MTLTDNQKKWIVSTANTFVTVFLMAIYPNIEKLNAQSLENGVAIGIIGAALRAAIKIIVGKYLTVEQSGEINTTCNK
jgi:hypothetical protein